MKPLKIAVPVVLVVLVLVGWVSTIRNLTSGSMELNRRIAIADHSYEQGLYQQAIMEYKDAIAAGMGLDGYRRIKEVYHVYLEEEPDNAAVVEAYLADMDEACTTFPEELEFWEILLDYDLSSEDYKAAFELVKRAYAAGISSEKIDACYETLRYETELVSDGVKSLRTASNGFGIAKGAGEEDDDKWYETDAYGNPYGGAGYDVIGLINDEGTALYVGDLGPRLIDGSGVVRARFDGTDITGAGLYDAASMLVPVQIGREKAWRYLDVGASLAQGETVLLEGSYDVAGSFYEGCAAVKEGESWHLIDTAGNAISESFEDIKLNPHENHVQAGFVFAKRDGSYGIYDTDLNRLGDFACDDIDLYFGGEPVAYKSGGKWGYVALGGDGSYEVVCEPRYHEAKSFLSGMAAVAEKDHSWGFIDGAYELRVPCEYYDALYFANEGVAVVCTGPDTYGCLSFVYS